MRKDGTFFESSSLKRMAHEHSLNGMLQDNSSRAGREDYLAAASARKTSGRQYVGPLNSTMTAEDQTKPHKPF